MIETPEDKNKLKEIIKDVILEMRAEEEYENVMGK